MPARLQVIKNDSTTTSINKYLKIVTLKIYIVG